VNFRAQKKVVTQRQSADGVTAQAQLV